MTIDIPGYKAGTYVLDSSHSDVNFEVRHMMISKVRGKFLVKQATLVLPENPLDATVEATADVASVDTNDEGRDGHLRSADFFDAENYPTITFASTAVREEGDGLVVDGDLTIKDVTRPITFSLELGGFGSDPWGNYKGGATAEATFTNTHKVGGLTVEKTIDGNGKDEEKDFTFTVTLEHAELPVDNIYGGVKFEDTTSDEEGAPYTSVGTFTLKGGEEGRLHHVPHPGPHPGRHLQDEGRPEHEARREAPLRARLRHPLRPDSAARVARRLHGRAEGPGPHRPLDV